MCFDIGIAVCGPNEALVISGMFQVVCSLVRTVTEDDTEVMLSYYCREANPDSSMEAGLLSILAFRQCRGFPSTP